MRELEKLDLNRPGQNVAEIATRHVRRLILRGTLAPGERLPSGRVLAKAWGISYVNAQKALADCAEQGLLTRRRNAGTVVSDNAGRRPLVRRVHALIQQTPAEARSTDYGRSPYFASLLSGMQEEFCSQGIMVVSSTVSGEHQERLFVESLHDHPVDVVLLFRSKNTPLIKALNRKAVPLMLVDPHVESAGQALILQDFDRGARDVANWLVSRGIRSPVLLAVDEGKWNSAERVAALRRALTTYYPVSDIDRGGLLPKDTPKKHIADCLVQLLRPEDPPDALVLSLVDPELVREAQRRVGLPPDGVCMVGYSRIRGYYRPGADLWLNSLQYGHRIARIVCHAIYDAREPLTETPFFVPLDLVDDGPVL